VVHCIDWWPWLGARPGVDLDDGAALGRIATQFDIRFGSDPLGEEIAGSRVTMLTPAIRNRVRGQRRLQSSRAAGGARRAPGAPAALLPWPRVWSRMGAIWARWYFPDAQVKIFLTASADERAARRHKQLKEKGVAANLAALSRK